MNYYLVPGNEIEPSKFAKISGRIKDAIATMSELLDEILVLGKVTSGSIVYHPENTDLVAIGQKLVDQFSIIQRRWACFKFCNHWRTLSFESGPPNYLTIRYQT